NLATPAPNPTAATPRPPMPSFGQGTKPKPKLPDIASTVPKATPKPLEPWEYKIDEVLRSSADETQTAQILINMLPTLPPDGQEEAAEHISNLILDEDYDKVLPLVRNPNLSEDVLDVFVTDLMNRDDNIKLPALLEIAKLPNHPHHEEALTDLEIFLDEDYGTDWTKWQTAMDKYLKEEAAEDAKDAALDARIPQPGR
ncbi:MAG: hypothetical protein ABI680_17010, partial [Chthoniobacteraceae bacterium]